MAGKKWLAVVILVIVAVGLLYMQGKETVEQLEAHILDVGQGDSILIRFPNKQTILIDAGTNSAGDRVVSYLKQQGITRIDYLVATHPHEDHIGGMTKVMEAFDIGRVYMPKVDHTSKTYEDLLLAIQDKGLKITAARAGLNIIEEEDLKAVFVAPCGTHYNNLNNYSAVVKVQYGKISFLLTGDAEAEAEQEMLAGKENLKADVLKVGHHGSSTSTTGPFLDAVSPEYAVISSGEGNQYGHPHRETLEKLGRAGTKIYRTDTQGTVLFLSDGLVLTIGEKKSCQGVVMIIINELKELMLR